MTKTGNRKSTNRPQMLVRCRVTRFTVVLFQLGILLPAILALLTFSANKSKSPKGGSGHVKRTAYRHCARWNVVASDLCLQQDSSSTTECNSGAVRTIRRTECMNTWQTKQKFWLAMCALLKSTNLGGFMSFFRVNDTIKMRNTKNGASAGYFCQRYWHCWLFRRMRASIRKVGLGMSSAPLTVTMPDEMS